MRAMDSPESSTRAAFTLIELLIVVAIIAILAAIGLPNLLEAQTRSKVGRVKADMRTLRTAIEAYAVDNNHYPRSSWGCAPFFDSLYGEAVTGTLTKDLTTPISYITSIPFDPFGPQERSVIYRMYSYDSAESVQELIDRRVEKNCPVPFLPGYIYNYGSVKTVRAYRRYFGEYYLWSVGPRGFLGDQTMTFSDWLLQYDPTNGTISTGRIFVAQKWTDPRYVPPNAFF